MNIEEIRSKIDSADTKLVELFVQRMGLCAQVAQYKRENGLPVLAPERERALLDRVQALGGKFGARTRELYVELLRLSRAYQTGLLGAFGLLGEKLSHSYSPRVQALLGIKNYALFEVPRDGVGDFVRTCTLDGFNVTVPYKQQIIPYLSAISPLCEKIGAVNTVVKRGGEYFGYNTDYFGFSELIRRAGFDVSGKKTLVLGSGGASKTAVAVCRDLSSDVHVISRSGEDNYSNIEKHFDADYIINCTPVGMFPNADPSPLPLDGFSKLSGVCDMIYNPCRTSLMLDAQRRGIPAVNGLYMLTAQAAASADLFTGGNGKVSPEIIKSVYDEINAEMTNIILIGMPGCGKSTAGAELSRLTNRPLYDTDEAVKELSGKTPRELIDELGEEYFRDVEAEAVKAVCEKRGAIIATGGGAVLREENVRRLRCVGYVVYLTREIKSLPKDGRPLSVDLFKVFEAREPLYKAAADAQVEVDADAKLTAQKILEAIRSINI